MEIKELNYEETSERFSNEFKIEPGLDVSSISSSPYVEIEYVESVNLEDIEALNELDISMQEYRAGNLLDM